MHRMAVSPFLSLISLIALHRSARFVQQLNARAITWSIGAHRLDSGY
jgi:hypothetical protein